MDIKELLKKSKQIDLDDRVWLHNYVGLLKQLPDEYLVVALRSSMFEVAYRMAGWEDKLVTVPTEEVLNHVLLEVLRYTKESLKSGTAN